jgi:hypothetical protein
MTAFHSPSVTGHRQYSSKLVDDTTGRSAHYSCVTDWPCQSSLTYAKDQEQVPRTSLRTDTVTRTYRVKSSKVARVTTASKPNKSQETFRVSDILRSQLRTTSRVLPTDTGNSNRSGTCRSSQTHKTCTHSKSCQHTVPIWPTGNPLNPLNPLYFLPCQYRDLFTPDQHFTLAATTVDGQLRGGFGTH